MLAVTFSSPITAPGSEPARATATGGGMWPTGLSGVVYGTALNDPAALAALGDAVHRPPYKAPPRAPVLYLKPRNTLAMSGAVVPVPADVATFEIGAALGLVIGRTACRVGEAQALQHLAGFVIVADLSVPHDSLYRPSLRFKLRDGSCLIGPRMLPCRELPDPDAVSLHIRVDGVPMQRAATAGMCRGVRRLLADVTEFMTLRPGDILMLGVRAGAPQARAGQRFSIDLETTSGGPALSTLEGALVAEEYAA